MGYRCRTQLKVSALELILPSEMMDTSTTKNSANMHREFDSIYVAEGGSEV